MTTLGIKALSILTLNIKDLFATLSISIKCLFVHCGSFNDMLNGVMLNVITMLNVVMLNVVMLNVVMLNIIMLIVVMLNVVSWKSY